MFTKSNKEPQMSHTRKHTRAPHLWFYSTPPLWWTLGHRRRDVTVSPTNIVGNGDQMAANHLTTFFFFFWGAPTHAHLSDETAEDTKRGDGCQNGRRLLFTNLIILFSSRWARWVITPPAYKSRGWCMRYPIEGRIIALREGACCCGWPSVRRDANNQDCRVCLGRSATNVIASIKYSAEIDFCCSSPSKCFPPTI